MHLQTRNELAQLIPSKSIGIELGVAKGQFSLEMLRSKRFDLFFCVDRWSDDNHDDRQYFKALMALERYQNARVLRSTFEDAVALFPDQYFDFIYIDGYAHTGQQSGQTLVEWYPKLKQGGLFCGHDFHSRWPLNVKCVQDFALLHAKTLQLTTADKYPSWYWHK